MSGERPNENKTVQVDSVWELDFLKWGDDLVVTPSESCPMQQVEVIKTICSRRGFIFQDREVTGAAPDENKSYRTVQVDSVWELDFLKWGDDLIVTPSESCPKQEVETIKTICSRRGFIFQDQEIPGAAGETSGASSGTGNDGETPGAGSGTGKEED